MQKTCLKCSSTLDPDAAFCELCGTPIVQSFYCPKCGGLVNSNARFCKYCACDLSPLVEPIPTSPPLRPPPNPVFQVPVPPHVKPPIPYQDDPSTLRSEISTDDPKSLISPSGAVFAVICFFLPWLQQSCGERTMISTGVDLANADSILWLLPLLGIVALAAYVACKINKVLYRARPFIIGSAGFALCFFIYKFSVLLMAVGYFNGSNGGPPNPTQIKPGSYGTVIGFILTIVGCLFIRRLKKVEVNNLIDDLTIFQSRNEENKNE